MLNIFFSLFLLGMLVVFMRQGNPPRHAPAAAVKQQGSCFAHSTFARLSFRPERRRQCRLQNPAAFLLKRAQPGCRICGSFFALRKKEADSWLTPRCLPLMLLFCFTFCHRNPLLKPFHASINNPASAN